MNVNDNAVDITEIAEMHDVPKRTALRIVIEADHEYPYRPANPIHVDSE